jgi:hypothetical protein
VNILESLPSSNLVSTALAFSFCQSAFVPYDFYSNDEEYLMLDDVAKTTPGRRDRKACLLTVPSSV